VFDSKTNYIHFYKPVAIFGNWFSVVLLVSFFSLGLGSENCFIQTIQNGKKKAGS